MERYWKLTKVLPNKENQKVVETFLSYLKLANLSEATIIRYRRQLEHFFGDMEIEYSSLPPNLILDWFQKNKSNLKESSYKTFLSTISSFYRFCVQEKLIEKSPIKKRWFPRLPQPLPKYLEREEVAKIRLVSERSSLRNQTIIEFL
jgi:site-specific recombinase XerD